jgi:hypothetical protein
MGKSSLWTTKILRDQANMGPQTPESAVKPYEFESAYQLLEDFWNDVNSFIKE